MIGRDVENAADPRVEGFDGLQLKTRNFGDHKVPSVPLHRGERGVRQRRAKVSPHEGIKPGGAQEVADQADRRALSIRAGNGDQPAREIS